MALSHRVRFTLEGWHWVTQAEIYLEGVALDLQGNICCSAIHIDICFSSVFASQCPTYTTSMWFMFTNNILLGCPCIYWYCKQCIQFIKQLLFHLLWEHLSSPINSFEIWCFPLTWSQIGMKYTIDSVNYLLIILPKRKEITLIYKLLKTVLVLVKSATIVAPSTQAITYQLPMPHSSIAFNNRNSSSTFQTRPKRGKSFFCNAQISTR